MKELLIVRHANASLNFKSLKDFDRTLNSEGENESKLMAKQLLNSNFYPDSIISSGANRAFSTSKIIAKKINFSINNNAIPISLGDSHKGYRVVGTTEDYFKHFSYGNKRKLKFIKGAPFNKVLDVVLGYEVAKTLAYDINDEKHLIFPEKNSSRSRLFRSVSSKKLFLPGRSSRTRGHQPKKQPDKDLVTACKFGDRIRAIGFVKKYEECNQPRTDQNPLDFGFGLGIHSNPFEFLKKFRRTGRVNRGGDADFFNDFFIIGFLDLSR